MKKITVRILVAYGFDGSVLRPHTARLVQPDGADGVEENFRKFWQHTHIEVVEVELPEKIEFSVTKGRTL